MVSSQMLTRSLDAHQSIQTPPCLPAAMIFNSRSSLHQQFLLFPLPDYRHFASISAVFGLRIQTSH